MSRDLREASRAKWVSNAESLSLEQINTGSMLRIADATELMARNYQRLISERDMYKRLFEEERATAKRLTRQANALRGVITRLKRKAGSQAPLASDRADEAL